MRQCLLIACYDLPALNGHLLIDPCLDSLKISVW